MRFLVLLLALLMAPAADAQTLGAPPTSNSLNCSGSIATGGTAQALTNLPTVLHGIQIQNLSTDVLGFSEFTTTPVVGAAGTWQLAASGGSYNSPSSYAPHQPIYIIGATTGDKFTCAAW